MAAREGFLSTMMEKFLGAFVSVTRAYLDRIISLILAQEVEACLNVAFASVLQGVLRAILTEDGRTRISIEHGLQMSTSANKL